MNLIQMADVVDLLGLPAPPNGRSSYYVSCPCCDEDPRKRHLNINVRKNVFRCPRCGVSGGIFDLYSLYTGIPRDEARDEIMSKLGTGRVVPKANNIRSVLPTVTEYPMTDVDTRDATYTALLAKLSLAPDHRDNLLQRGLTGEEIEQLGYKTTPVLGYVSIAAQLQAEGFYLSGVPGFYRREDDVWTFNHEKRGILIPVRDVDGKIQGLQIRRDNVSKRKFRWVSSAEKKDGCRAEGWTHLAGAVRDEIILTEGPMKADIIHDLSGDTVLAVPGVNTLTQLKLTLERLMESGLRQVKTAFDMDLLTNIHVQNGYNNLLALLDELDLRFGTYLWDPRYKGLDDYIWEYCLDKHRSA